MEIDLLTALKAVKCVNFSFVQETIQRLLLLDLDRLPRLDRDLDLDLLLSDFDLRLDFLDRDLEFFLFCDLERLLDRLEFLGFDLDLDLDLDLLFLFAFFADLDLDLLETRLRLDLDLDLDFDLALVSFFFKGLGLGLLVFLLLLTSLSPPSSELSDSPTSPLPALLVEG